MALCEYFFTHDAVLAQVVQWAKYDLCRYYGFWGACCEEPWECSGGDLSLPVSGARGKLACQKGPLMRALPLIRKGREFPEEEEEEEDFCCRQHNLLLSQSFPATM